MHSESNSILFIPLAGSGCLLTLVPISSVARSCLTLCIVRYIPSSLTQFSKANRLRNYSPMASGAVGMREVGWGGGKGGEEGEAVFLHFNSASAHRAPSGL